LSLKWFKTIGPSFKKTRAKLLFLRKSQIFPVAEFFQPEMAGIS